MADPKISPDELGRLREILEDTRRRIKELEKPTGTQLTRLADRVEEALLNLSAQVAAEITAQSYTCSVIDSKWAAQDAATAAALESADSREPRFAVLAPGKGGTGTSSVYDRTGIGTHRQVYVNSAGELTVGASSERYKENFTDWAPDVGALLGVVLREFDWIGHPSDRDIGLIAEELQDAELQWLVRYDGPVIEGIRTERLPFALLKMVQETHHKSAVQQANIDELVARVYALEGGVV